MKYNYQARTLEGKIQAGIVEATDKIAAVDTLKSKGLYVTAIEEFSPPIYAKRLKILERISQKDIVLFCRQMAIMFKSRVPLVEIFYTFAKQTKNSNLKEVILRLAEEVEGGSSLSESFAIYPKLFSPFFINMVKSGEATGKLTDIFLYLADYLEKEYHFRGKIIGAMIYPGFIFFVFVVVFSIVVGYVIPQLTMVLKETGTELPLITRIAIGVSDFFQTKWWVFLIALVALIVGVMRALKIQESRRWIHENILKVPLIGPFLRKMYLSRFAFNLSTLISGGLPIVQGLEITGQVVGNMTYQEIIFKVRDGVKKGETMSSVLQNYPQSVSPLFFQMVIVGEKTGTLDTSLNNVVEFYQKEIDRNLDDLIKLIEPIFIILLGLIVGGLVGAVMIPLYSGIGNIQ